MAASKSAATAPPATDAPATDTTVADTTDAGTAATGPGGGTASDAELATKLDTLNLEQALADFAAANARVLDLTRRLSTLTEQAVRLRDENVRQAIELERLRPAAFRLEALERSRAVQLAGALKSALQRGRHLAGR